MNIRANIPQDIAPDRVFEFDIYDDPAFSARGHWGYADLFKNAPDIFYTPRNGGHWVVTRYDLQQAILRDVEHFSSRELHVPRMDSPNLMIPINLDPPVHTQYRTVLMSRFDRKAIASLEPRVRHWANHLIDGVIAAGQCDFADTLGPSFPVTIFMELMGIPFEKFTKFRSMALEYVTKLSRERRLALEDEIIGSMWALAEERRAAPRDDLISTLVSVEMRGRKLTDDEIKSMMFLLFLAGLDTVANALTFAFRQLASDPALQARLAAEPERIPDFVEESLRCFGVSSVSRLVKQDREIDGVTLRAGEMIMCPTSSAGHDDRANPDPETFDIDRRDRKFMTFSAGPHICIGNLLARSEMRVFVQTWLERIPSFSIAKDADLGWQSSTHLSMRHLPLRWPTQN